MQKSPRGYISSTDLSLVIGSGEFAQVFWGVYATVKKRRVYLQLAGFSPHTHSLIQFPLANVCVGYACVCVL